MTFEQWLIDKKITDLSPVTKAIALKAWDSATQASAQKWQQPETAPKDGTTFLADIGYPWPVLCVWHDLHQEWAYAEYQVNMVEGEYNDPYFQTEYEKEIKAWMPLPSIANRKGQITKKTASALDGMSDETFRSLITKTNE